jgi:amidase
MGRRVDDVAAALQAVAGFDPYDPRQSRMVPDSLDALSHLGDGVKGLRIGILEEGFDEPADADVTNGALEAVDVLARAGAIVTRVTIPEHRSINAVYAALAFEGARSLLDTGLCGAGSKTYYPAGAIAAVDTMWREHADGFPARTKLNHMIAAMSRRRYHGAVYAKAHNLRPTFTRAYDTALARVDVLAMPTVRTVAPPVEEPPTDRLRAVDANLRRNWIVLPRTYNTKPANYTGHPALAIPCGRVDDLPISLQLIGRHFDDALLLRAAYAYQQSVDWDRLISVRVE